MKQQLSLDGKPIFINVKRMVNAGFAGSNQAAVRAHIEEMAAIGVPVPERVPTYYPVPVTQLAAGDTIQVTHGRTSAEIEYVFIHMDGKEYITVGSDHTDRELEGYSVPKSKQICPNMIASEIWEYNSVKDHLDQLVLTCEVYENGGWRLYQNGKVTDLLAPEAHMKLGSKLMEDSLEGLVLFSGTIPTIGEITYASRWRVTMKDLKLGKQITAEYTVEQLPDPLT